MIPERVIRAIIRGERFNCTACVYRAAAYWCEKCNAPRCAFCLPLGECRVCKKPPRSFGSIIKLEKEKQQPDGR